MDSLRLSSSRERWLILVFLSLSYMTVFMQRTGPGVITDQLQSEFHLSAAVIGTMASIQYLMYMGLQIPVGLLGDKFDPQRLFVTGVLLDGVGTILFADAHGFPWLLMSRAIVGIGDALIWVNIVLILGRRFAPQQFGRSLSVVATSGNVGALLTTIPFAAWVAIASWRTPFTSLGILLVAIALFDYLVLYSGQRKTNIAGERASSTEKEDDGLSPRKPKTTPMWKTLGVVVRDRIAWATFFTHFASVGTYIGFTGVWAIPYFMNTYGFSRSAAATLTMTAFVGAIIGGPLAGALTDRLGERRRPYLGFQTANTIVWAIIPLCGGHPPMWLMYVLMFVLGIGNGASLLTFAVVRNETPQARAGVTSGFANTGGFLSAVLFPILFGFVIDLMNPGYTQGTPPSAHAYALAFLVPCLFSFLGMVGSWMIVENREAWKETHSASVK
jgi:sugar phosphate permease